MNISDETIRTEYTKNGLSMKEIARKYPVSDTGVKYRLMKMGIPINPASKYKRIPFDTHYFDDIDCVEKAYWLGWLFSDGYNNEDKNYLCFSIKKDDACVLEKFKKDIKFEGKINFTNGQKCDMASVKITDEHFSDRLAKIGCFQRKSLHIRIPPKEIIPKNLLWHFIRGLLDGDGCVFWDKKRCYMSICGGEKLIDDLIELFLSEGIEPRKYRKENSCYCTVGVSYDIILLGNLIYKDSIGCRLERKYKNFNLFKKHLTQKFREFQFDMEQLGLIPKQKSFCESVMGE